MRQTKIFLLLSMLVMLCLMMSAAVADETWRPENYTFLKPAPKERIFASLPDGLAATCNISDGKIEYIIDADATDWLSVLAQTYQPASGQVYLSSGIKMPTDGGIVGQRTQSYSMDMGNPEGKIVDLIQQQYNKYGLQSRGDASTSYWIGHYEESSSTYLPMERLGLPMGMATLWYDESGKVIRGEYIAYTIAYINADARTVKLDNVPAADITLNVPVNTTNFDTVGTHNKEDGIVRYQVENPANLSNKTVFTAVAIPTISGVDTSNWTCHVRRSDENKFSPCLMADAGDYGLAKRSVLLEDSLSASDAATQTSYMLSWRDANGKAQYISKLVVLTVSGAPAPFPIYENWKPIPAERLNLSYVNPIESGTRLTYDPDKGIAYCHITPENLPETASYGDTLMNLEFLPPSGATAFSFARGNSTKAFGQSSNLATYSLNQLFGSSRFRYDDEGFSIGYRLFETYRQQSSDLTLYKTAMMPSEFAAEFAIINWYRDINDSEPMLREYVFCKMDDCLLQHVSEPYASEDALPDTLVAPVIVIPNENSAKEMQFIAEIYPIESENSRYYELRLVDQDGTLAKLPAKAKIILRYPEGLTLDEASKMVFNLRHLNSSYQTMETFSAEEGNLHFEENYMWFTPSSLSPFVLEWTVTETENTQAPNLPDTGDHSRPLALLALLAATSCGMYIQLRRRKI